MANTARPAPAPAPTPTPMPTPAPADVLEAQVEEMTPAKPPRRANLDAPTAEVLTRIYLDKRLRYQMNWYQSRMTENDYNDGTMFKAAAWVMAISSVLAMGGAISDSTVLPLLTALLPPVAALITSFRSLYQWDKQTSIYQDTVLGLEEAMLVLPDQDDLEAFTAFTVYPQLVRSAESVFEKEAQQWGQVAAGQAEDRIGANVDAVERFANEFGLSILDDDGMIDEEKMGKMRAILQASDNYTRRPALTSRPAEQLPSSVPSNGAEGVTPAGPDMDVAPDQPEPPGPDELG